MWDWIGKNNTVTALEFTNFHTRKNVPVYSWIASSRKKNNFAKDSNWKTILANIPTLKRSVGLIITGDFNKMKLGVLCRRFHLCKKDMAYTRGKNTLDQILMNMSDLYTHVKHLPPLGRSDHQCFLLNPIKRKPAKIAQGVHGFWNLLTTEPSV
jgi:hypothetical protein